MVSLKKLLKIEISLVILVFIDEECGSLIVVHDGGELTKNFNHKKRSDVLQYPIVAQSVISVVGKSIYLVTIWNICCESDKYDFCCHFFH